VSLAIQRTMRNRQLTQKTVQHSRKSILSKMWISCKFVDYAEAGVLHFRYFSSRGGLNLRYFVVWVTKFHEYILPALLLIKSMAVNGLVRQLPTRLCMTNNTGCFQATEHLCFHQIVVAVHAFSLGHVLSSIICMQVQFERRNSESGYVFPAL